MGLYQFPSTKRVERKQACVACGTPSGMQVGLVDYIGLQDVDIVQCPNCGLISHDPIADMKTFQEGCNKLYRIQQSHSDKKQTLQGFKRAFRNGNFFARKYLSAYWGKNFDAKILEVGSGDGYFLQGVKNQFPKSRIHYLDLASELMPYYKEYFDCVTHCGELESLEGHDESFDLIVFRDLLEHVRNPLVFLNEAYKKLKAGGRIFFITPNGKEDLWMTFQRFEKTYDRKLWLLNHIHFFLPESLDFLLKKSQFQRELSFKYGLKHHKKGYGVDDFFEFEKENVPELPPNVPALKELWAHNPEDIRKSPLNNGGWLSYLYCHTQRGEIEKTGYEAPEGHEFFVVAKKPN